MSQRTATLEPPLRLVVAAIAWIAAALALALSGAVGAVPSIVPICTFGVIAVGLVAYRVDPGLRGFADRIDLRIPILLHAVRVPIGAYILVETGRGVLPSLFGNRAGPGDIVVGLLAIGVAAAAVARGRVRRSLVVAWSVLGILDLVVAFGTAQYLLFVVQDPRMTIVGQLPWTLLPTVAVPLMILTHLLVLARLRRA